MRRSNRRRGRCPVVAVASGLHQYPVSSSRLRSAHTSANETVSRRSSSWVRDRSTECGPASQAQLVGPASVHRNAEPQRACGRPPRSESSEMDSAPTVSESRRVGVRTANPLLWACESVDGEGREFVDDPIAIRR
jgi:hypothetical protein